MYSLLPKKIKTILPKSLFFGSPALPKVIAALVQPAIARSWQIWISNSFRSCWDLEKIFQHRFPINSVIFFGSRMDFVCILLFFEQNLFKKSGRKKIIQKTVETIVIFLISVRSAPKDEGMPAHKCRQWDERQNSNSRNHQCHPHRLWYSRFQSLDFVCHPKIHPTWQVIFWYQRSNN